MGKFLEVVTAVCLLRKAQPFVKAQSPSSLHILLSQHPQLHGSSAKSLLPTGLTWPDPRRCAYSPVTEIRRVVLEQMSSVSPAPFLVCLLPWPISCFHSAKWLVSHCNPLRWEDKGSIRSTAWSNVPRHLIKSSLHLSSSWRFRRQSLLQASVYVAVFEALFCDTYTEIGWLGLNPPQ